MTREQLHASVNFPGQSVHFYMGRVRPDGTAESLTPEGMKPWRPGYQMEPSFTVSMETAQKLYEELHSQGFRSTRDRGSSDRLDEARKEHLEDLRKVAFG